MMEYWNDGSGNLKEAISGKIRLDDKVKMHTILLKTNTPLLQYSNIPLSR